MNDELQLIKCPHCHAKVQYELDQCPECGKELYENYDVSFDEKNYDNHYDDYLTTNRDVKPFYKFLLTLSTLAIIAGLYFLFIVHKETPGEKLDFILAYGGIILHLGTRVLIWFDHRQTA